MMTDLISKSAIVDRLREEAKKLAEKAIHSKGQAVDYYTGMKTGMARAAIWANGTPTVDAEWMLKHGMIPDADFPAIDAVPVVRCKECKHWGMHKSLNVPWCFEMHIDKSEDGYCDSGERREDE